MAAGSPRRLRDLAIAVYTALFAVWGVTGHAPVIWPAYVHLIDPRLLQERLLAVLLNLHAQPPLGSLVLGLILKLGAVSGVRPELVMLALHYAMGLVIVVRLVGLVEGLLGPRARWVVVALVLLNPYLYASLYDFFSTPYELLFLVLLGYHAMGWYRDGEPRAVVKAALAAACLVYTRSLFHPVWFLATLWLLTARPRRVRGASTIPAVMVALIVVVLAWPTKNLLRFGVFSFSSWEGYNFSRGVPITPPPLLGVFYDTVPPADDVREALTRLVPARFREAPELAAVSKANGTANWNHYAIIGISRECGARALAVLWDAPWRVAAKALRYYLHGYSTYEGRYPYSQQLGAEFGALTWWAAAYEALVFQRFRAHAPFTLTTGFGVVVPGVLVAAFVALRRAGAPASADTATVVLLYVCVLWVLAAVLFIDGLEGNRMRFSTEPFLFVIAAWLVAAIGRERAQRIRP